MTPVDFPEANRTFTKPAGMTDEECQPLRVHDTGEALVSCWRLSAEELAEVQRTGLVWLWVHGRGHPPASVEAESPFEPPRPPPPAPQPLQEGTVRKGGQNLVYQIKERPPDPPPMKPGARRETSHA